MYYKVSARGTAARRMRATKEFSKIVSRKAGKSDVAIAIVRSAGCSNVAGCTKTAVTRLEGTKRPSRSESFGVDRIEFAEK